MRLNGLDLNLLVALRVLLEERSVSRAAERMNISQPAMSSALGRLRDYFDDPILLVYGKKMIPTPAALRMESKLSEVLNDIDALIAQTGQFDPLVTERKFKIAGSDYVFAVLLPCLMSGVGDNISIELIQNSDASRDLLAQGAIDLMIAPEGHISADHPAEMLFQERHVVVGWNKNPAIKDGKISKKDFFDAPHIVSELGRVKRASFAETNLARQTKDRRIAMRVSSFLVAPYMVIGANYLTVMHERLALRMKSGLEIAIADLPFKFPLMNEMAQFHEARKADPGLRWIIDRLKRQAAR
ncbi:MAG: LysR family transcriptional regulator [Parvularculaceae bacterium]